MENLDNFNSVIDAPSGQHKKEENIFSLTNLDDLSEDFKLELRITNTGDEQILTLFSIKQILTIDEVLVGLARKFHSNKKRAYVINRLYTLGKKGFVQKIKGKKGAYQVVN